MPERWSRRTFFQVMTAGLGVGAVVAMRLIRRRACIACGATGFAHAHVERGRSGIYCPNCGINFVRGAWDVDRHAGGETLVSLDVPFPNRKRVTATGKPAIVLADYQL